MQLSVLGWGSFCMIGCSNAAVQEGCQPLALLRCSSRALQLFGVVETSVSHLPLHNGPCVFSGVQGYKQVLKPGAVGR